LLKIIFNFYVQQESFVRPPRIEVTLVEPENNNIADPLIVVIRHHTGVLSWQLPYTEKQQQEIE